MPRGVYKRKRRKYAKRIGEPTPSSSSLKELLDELEGEHVRHRLACEQLAKRISELLGFNS